MDDPSWKIRHLFGPIMPPTPSIVYPYFQDFETGETVDIYSGDDQAERTLPTDDNSRAVFRERRALGTPIVEALLIAIRLVKATQFG